MVIKRTKLAVLFFAKEKQKCFPSFPRVRPVYANNNKYNFLTQKRRGKERRRTESLHALIAGLAQHNQCPAGIHSCQLFHRCPKCKFSTIFFFFFFLLLQSFDRFFGCVCSERTKEGNNRLLTSERAPSHSYRPLSLLQCTVRTI